MTNITRQEINSDFLLEIDGTKKKIDDLVAGQGKPGGIAIIGPDGKLPPEISGGGGGSLTQLMVESGKTISKGMGVSLNSVGKVEPTVSQHVIPKLRDNAGTNLPFTQGYVHKGSIVELSEGKYLVAKANGAFIDVGLITEGSPTTYFGNSVSLAGNQSGDVFLVKVSPTLVIYFDVRGSTRDNSDGSITTSTSTFHYGTITITGNQTNIVHRGLAGFAPTSTSGGGTGTPGVHFLTPTTFLMACVGVYAVFSYNEGTGILTVSKGATALSSNFEKSQGGMMNFTSYMERVGNTLFYSHNYYQGNLFSFTIDGSNVLSNPIKYPLGFIPSGYVKVDNERFLVYNNSSTATSSTIVLVTLNSTGLQSISPAINLGSTVKDIYVDGNMAYVLSEQGTNLGLYLLRIGSGSLSTVDASTIQPELTKQTTATYHIYKVWAIGNTLCIVSGVPAANHYSNSFNVYRSLDFKVDSTPLGFASSSKTAGELIEILTSGVIEGLSGLEVAKYYRTKNGVLTIQTTKDEISKSVGQALSPTKLLIL